MANEEYQIPKELTCPFCGEADFDAVGLKSHLLRYCEVFDGIERVAANPFQLAVGEK